MELRGLAESDRTGVRSAGTEVHVFLALLLGCATHTVRTLAQVSPGGGSGEFYALVREETWNGAGALLSVDGLLIRCVTQDMTMDRSTSCQQVLTDEEAFRAADRQVPITFGPAKEVAK
jgi:hypothetical protein